MAITNKEERKSLISFGSPVNTMLVDPKGLPMIVQARAMLIKLFYRALIDSGFVEKAIFVTNNSILTIDGNDYALIEANARQSAADLDVSDQSSAGAFVDMVAGERVLECTVIFIKDVNQQNLIAGSVHENTQLAFEGYLYQGTATIIEIEDSAEIDNAIIQTMRLKFTGRYLTFPTV